MNEIKALEIDSMPSIPSKNCLVQRCKKQEKFNKKYQHVKEQCTNSDGHLLSIIREEK